MSSLLVFLPPLSLSFFGLVFSAASKRGREQRRRRWYIQFTAGRGGEGERGGGSPTSNAVQIDFYSSSPLRLSLPPTPPPNTKGKREEGGRVAAATQKPKLPHLFVGGK